MVRRVMAVLGLMAFAITVLGGLVRQNSLEFTLTRALWAMIGFCFLGMIVGWAAERVVREHRGKQHEQVFGHAEGSSSTVENGGENAEEISSTSTGVKPIQN